MPDTLVLVAAVDGLRDGQSFGCGPALALALVVLPLEEIEKAEQGKGKWLKMRWRNERYVD